MTQPQLQNPERRNRFLLFSVDFFRLRQIEPIRYLVISEKGTVASGKDAPKHCMRFICVAGDML